MAAPERITNKPAGHRRTARPGEQMTTTTPLEQLAERLDDYARFVHQRFFRKLSREDSRDAAQDAFIAAATSVVCPNLDAVQLDLWIRRAAYNKALDALKARHGEGAVRRQVTANVDDFAELLAAEGDPIEDEIDDQDDASVFRAAFDRLPASQQRVLSLRHFDSLPVSACAELLGVPDHKYERLHTDAVSRLVNLIVGIRPHGSCQQVRSLIDLSVHNMLDTETAARRDAHLEGCFHCRRYRQHSKGLLVFVPLPAVGFADRFAARLQGLLERVMPIAQKADAATTAGGAGALGAGGTKLAAVVAAGVAAVGAGTVVIQQQVVAAHHQGAKADAVVGAPRAVAAPASAAASATTTSAAAAMTKAARFGVRARIQARAKVATKRHRASHVAVGSGELKPLGHEVAVPAATTTAAAPVPAPTPARAATTTSPTPKSAPAAVPAVTPADSSSGEFAPHP
jgi:RNA polymerase sigma factor (sigma-70 family)